MDKPGAQQGGAMRSFIRKQGKRLRNMPLRVRAQLIVGSALLVLFAFAMALSMAALRRGFLRFERKDMKNQLSRVEILLNEQLGALGNYCTDYAQWDDTYRFINGAYPGYVQSNISPETFQNTDIDVFVLLRPDGSVFYQALRPGRNFRISAKNAKIRSDGLMNISPGILPVFAKHGKLLSLDKRGDSASGLMTVGPYIMLTGASPVLRTDGSGPSRGVLVFGRLLDERRIGALSRISQTSLDIEAAHGADPREMHRTRTVFRTTRSHMHISENMQGLLGQGLFQLRMTSRRDLLPQLRTSGYLLFGNLLLMGLVCVGLIGLLLNRTVLSRVADFVERADRLRQSHDRTLRMPHGGRDEVDNLALAINELLDELQSVQDRLEHDALHDSLTNLGNRTLLMSRLELTHAFLARDPEYRFALYLLDLDGFKDINDAHGHSAGDYVLKTTAARIVDCTRGSDTVVRLGGDEFVILQMDLDDTGYCQTFARQLVEMLRIPIQWEGNLLQVTVSIGVVRSIARCAQCTPSELLRDADIAMYTAKQDGKNKHSVFDCSQRETVTRHLILNSELKCAADRGQLEVWYQPLISNITGRAACLEALMRWCHPDRGLLAPPLFIPIAEESHVIANLDEWMLRNALRGIRQLRKASPELRVSVNFSVKMMLQPDVADMVKDALDDAGLPPNALCIELTESALAKNENALTGPMRGIMDLGVSLYLDDFGTGYSSLGRLNLLPVQMIKIDRSFVRRIDKGEQQIVEAVIQMAHALDKQVVAEGVETRVQHDTLRDLGCDFLQGFLYAQPLPAEEIERYIRNHKPWDMRR